MRRALISAASALIVLVATGASRADTHVEAQLLGFTSPTFVDRSMHVSNDNDGATMLDANDVRLVGNGAISGGALRGVVHCDRLRIGFEEALVLASGLDVTTGTLPAGFHTDHGKIWGMRLELSIGRDFVSEDEPKDEIAPYVDLRVGLTFLTSKVQLHSATLGALGSVDYELWSPYLGPRAGVRVPLGENGFVDFSGCLNIFGLERGSLNAGLGVFI